MTSQPGIAPLLAMIRAISPRDKSEFVRALAARLNAPPTAAERRVRDLTLLANVLDEVPQVPGRLPYVTVRASQAWSWR